MKGENRVRLHLAQPFALLVILVSVVHPESDSGQARMTLIGSQTGKTKGEVMQRFWSISLAFIVLVTTFVASSSAQSTTATCPSTPEEASHLLDGSLDNWSLLRGGSLQYLGDPISFMIPARGLASIPTNPGLYFPGEVIEGSLIVFSCVPSYGQVQRPTISCPMWGTENAAEYLGGDVTNWEAVMVPRNEPYRYEGPVISFTVPYRAIVHEIGGNERTYLPGDRVESGNFSLVCYGTHTTGKDLREQRRLLRPASLFPGYIATLCVAGACDRELFHWPGPVNEVYYAGDCSATLEVPIYAYDNPRYMLTYTYSNGEVVEHVRAQARTIQNVCWAHFRLVEF